MLHNNSTTIHTAIIHVSTQGPSAGALGAVRYVYVIIYIYIYIGFLSLPLSLSLSLSIYIYIYIYIRIRSFCGRPRRRPIWAANARMASGAASQHYFFTIISSEFTGMSPEFRKQSARISNLSTLNEGTTTTKPSCSTT